MITLDTTSIDSGATDEVYSVERGSRVYVFLNGQALKKCVYCNVSKGVAICLKRDLAGDTIAVTNDGSIIHELVFGAITVEKMDDTEQRSQDSIPIPLPEKPKK